MKRIKSAAAARGAELLVNNRWVPTGAASIEPEQSCETVVRFG